MKTDVLRMICLSLFYNIIYIHQEPMTVHYIFDTDLSSSKKNIMIAKNQIETCDLQTR